MRAFTFVLALGLAPLAHAAETKDVPAAEEIFNRYLNAPYPKGPSATDPHGSPAHVEAGKAREARVAILTELRAIPEEAVSAAEAVLLKCAESETAAGDRGHAGRSFSHW